MGIDRNRTIAAKTSPGWLSSLLNRAKPAPAEPGIFDMLDRLNLGARPPAGGAVPGAEATLALLTGPTQVARVDAAGWEALGQAWSMGTGVERSRMAARLQAAGVRVEQSADQRYVTFSDGCGLWATVEPATERLRLWNGNVSQCYEGESLVLEMTTSAKTISMRTADGTQVWQGDSGQGFKDGWPISAPPQPYEPGEAPRRPWAQRPANELQEPAWSAKQGMEVYAPEYDLAMLAAGGEVVEASVAHPAEQDTYNCHSFSTTGTEGDLFDPFSRPGFPHWLNNPMYQLNSGAFNRVQPTQRVHPGDVVVYRSNETVTHTGVVREVDSDGNPSLIESKFGQLGRFLHEPFDVAKSYGAPAEFYRPVDANE